MRALGHRAGRRAGGVVAAACGVLLAAAPATAAAAPATTPSATAPSAGVAAVHGSAVGPAVGGPRLGAPGVQLDLPPGVPAPKAPRAAAWLVADLDTRGVLAAQQVHRGLAPASTLKIFTALALAPGLDPGAAYTASDADAGVDGTKVGLVPGSRYTVDDLLHGMLMGSGNDCAHALGELAGGQQEAVRRMSAEATRLGAADTVPRTTSGLDARGQVSSAYDLALAGTAALADPQLARIMRTTSYPFPGRGRRLGHGRAHFATQNHNRLLGSLPGATGVKNGYTVAARASLVASATRGGRSYLVVLLRAEGSIWQAATDLLTWAFRYGPQAGAVGTLVREGAVAAGAQAAGGTSVRAHLAAAALPHPASGWPLHATASARRATGLAAGVLGVALLGALVLSRGARSGHPVRQARRGAGGGRGGRS